MLRARDPIWDALTEAFGEVRTPSERGRRNRAVAELRAAQATAEEIAIAARYCKRFPSHTEMAVCSWLSRSLHEVKATNAPPLAEVLHLPELSEEERLANLERLKGMGL